MKHGTKVTPAMVMDHHGKMKELNSVLRAKESRRKKLQKELQQISEDTVTLLELKNELKGTSFIYKGLPIQLHYDLKNQGHERGHFRIAGHAAYTRAQFYRPHNLPGKWALSFHKEGMYSLSIGEMQGMDFPSFEVVKQLAIDWLRGEIFHPEED